MATHTHADGTVHDGPDHFTPSVSADPRKTFGKGRIRGLQDRLSPAQSDKRQSKILARRTVAENLTHQTGQTLGYVYALGQVVKRERYYVRALAILAGLQAGALAYLFAQ